jgi:hypothetical protein
MKWVRHSAQSSQVSPLAANASGAGAVAEGGEEVVLDPSAEPLDPQHVPSGVDKYRTLEQMSADIKGLDEVRG